MGFPAGPCKATYQKRTKSEAELDRRRDDYAEWRAMYGDHDPFGNVIEPDTRTKILQGIAEAEVAVKAERATGVGK